MLLQLARVGLLHSRVPQACCMALAVVKGEREDSCSFNKSSRDSVLHSVLRIAVQVCAAATPRSPLYLHACGPVGCPS